MHPEVRLRASACRSVDGVVSLMCTPRVGLLGRAEVDERLGRRAHRDGADLVVDEREEVVVVLAHDLDQQVERAGGEHDVDDVGDVREHVGHGADVAVDVDADHRHAVEAERQGIGDRHDLQDAGVDELLHALAHRRLGQADRLGDARVRPAAVLLQLLDDRRAASSSTTGAVVCGLAADRHPSLTMTCLSSV